MGHGNDRTVSHTPSLIRISERRGRTADCIHIVPHIVGIHDLRRSTSFRHGLGIESPELIPCDFRLAHKERGYRNLALRGFIAAAERFILWAPEHESAARDGHHIDGSRCPRYFFSEIAEPGDNGGFSIYLLSPALRTVSPHCPRNRGGQ